MRHPPGVPRKRPRLCEVCHAEATIALAHHELATTIRRDGTRRTTVRVVRTFRCHTHAVP